MNQSTAEDIIGVVVVLAPLGLLVPLQLFGQRMGWSGRRLLRIWAYIMWLWYSAALGIAWARNLSDFALGTFMIGVLVYAAMRFMSWAYGHVLDRYERYIERLYQEKGVGRPK
jgi:hypothetical protein